MNKQKKTRQTSNQENHCVQISQSIELWKLFDNDKNQFAEKEFLIIANIRKMLKKLLEIKKKLKK